MTTVSNIYFLQTVNTCCQDPSSTADRSMSGKCRVFKQVWAAHWARIAFTCSVVIWVKERRWKLNVSNLLTAWASAAESTEHRLQVSLHLCPGTALPPRIWRRSWWTIPAEVVAARPFLHQELCWKKMKLTLYTFIMISNKNSHCSTLYDFLQARSRLLFNWGG